jgi:hypothetical protein
MKRERAYKRKGTALMKDAHEHERNDLHFRKGDRQRAVESASARVTGRSARSAVVLAADEAVAIWRRRAG